MCGIALIVGPGADERLFRRMLASIRPRGDVVSPAAMSVALFQRRESNT